MKNKKNTLIISEDGKKFLIKDTTKDFHCQYGQIKKEDMDSESGTEIKTNKGKKLYVVESTFPDNFGKIKRGAQIIPSKDVGFILSETGLSKDSIVIDAGAGSGGLCLVLANIAKKVYSYDIREDHLDIVRKNKETLKLNNLVLDKKDIYKDRLPKSADLVTLDVPEPWLAIENIDKYLKPGKYIVSYSPSIPQVMDLISSLEKTKNIIHLRTIEIIEREWEFQGRKVRPKTQQRISHSGFLTFLRKIKK